jgi:2-deoxy-D-gluconate 3-dehydrogenase
LADAEGVKSLAKKVVGSKQEGGLGETIDILLNCGGIQRRGAAETFSDQDWDEVIQVNLNAVFILSRDFGRHMLETRSGAAAKEANRRGRAKIINIASMNSFHGGIQVPAYAAAKHAVLGVTKALSNEWAGRGINVNAIAPGRTSLATRVSECTADNAPRLHLYRDDKRFEDR